MSITTDNAIRLFQVFSARLVLEVFGGGGAIWGFSEAVTLRNHDTQEFWRQIALVVGAIFFVRWLLQIKDFVLELNGASNNIDKDRSFTRMLQIFSAKMVLEVWGGAGAIWGFSEAMSLRRPDTQEIYRFYALTVGCIFFIRWCLQIEEFRKGDDTKLDASKSQWIRYLQIFSARMVLEVFGGGGAIWGFSEVCTLRKPSTQEEWRSRASFIALVFLIRFVCQTKDYFMEAKYGESYHVTFPRSNLRLLQVFSARLVLEVFGGGGAIWGFSEAMSLRRPDTQEFYRAIALLVAAIFFARFLFQIRDFIAERTEEDVIPTKPDLDLQYSLPLVEKKDSAPVEVLSETTPLVKS